VASVLLVEDDPELRRVVGYALMDEGIACVEAANGQEAIEALCQCTAEGRLPDCVVLDIFMPGGVDGWQVLESMRVNPLWADTRVIVLTGKATLPAEVARAERLGARHMAKTARFVDELVVALKGTLSGHTG
jgi:CheY-like chemotaxis protein